MKISYTFDEDEIERVQHIVADKLAAGRVFVQHRLKHNVEGVIGDIDDNKLWMAQMMCLLTTQQRSGPNSPINQFLDLTPFPLSLEACQNSKSLHDDAFNLLTEARGIRRTDKIAEAVDRNFRVLEQGEWETLRKWSDKLIVQRNATFNPSHRELEEKASEYVQDCFHQFGAKQSRNFWQSLGLTRYVFVLDSRILRWVRSNMSIESGFLTSSGLSDGDYYNFISNMLLELCNEADVLPCMLDAAIFDSFDEETEWENDVIW